LHFSQVVEGEVSLDALKSGHEEATARLQFNLGCLLNQLGKHVDAKEVLLRCTMLLFFFLSDGNLRSRSTFLLPHLFGREVSMRTIQSL
jgi:hypothetical protein